MIIFFLKYYKTIYEDFKKQKITIILTKIFRKIINIINNNNNCNIKTNGELFFINEIKKEYKEKLIVFDVGANLGEYSDNFLDHSNLEVHMFEPQKKCFNFLMNKYKNNEKIIINNFGVSNNDCELYLYSDFEGSGLASLYKRNLDFLNIKIEKREKVKLVKLDKYISENKIKKINLLKIDIEGHEMEALKGLGSYLNPGFIDYIQFEYGGANIESHINLNDFYELFSNMGFVMCKMKKRGIEIVKYNQILEDFSYQNWVAVSKKIINN